MKQLLINLLCKLLGIAKALFVVVGPAVGDAILRILNNAEYQKLAIACCANAYRQGFTGWNAWDKARTEFIAELSKRGVKLADHLIDTILQTAYAIWKNSPK